MGPSSALLKYLQARGQQSLANISKNFMGILKVMSLFTKTVKYNILIKF